MKRGVTERYGKDIFERLERDGEIDAPRRNRDGSMTTYKLTRKAILAALLQTVSSTLFL